MGELCSTGAVKVPQIPYWGTQRETGGEESLTKVNAAVQPLGQLIVLHPKLDRII